MERSVDIAVDSCLRLLRGYFKGALPLFSGLHLRRKMKIGPFSFVRLVEALRSGTTLYCKENPVEAYSKMI